MISCNTARSHGSTAEEMINALATWSLRTDNLLRPFPIREDRFSSRSCNAWHGTEGSNTLSGNTKSAVLGDHKISWEPFQELEGLSVFPASSHGHICRYCERGVRGYRFARLSGIAAVQGLDNQSFSRVVGERRPWVAIGKSDVPCRAKDPESLILLEA